MSVAICIADSQGILCDHSGLANGASVKYKTTGDGALHREVRSGRKVSDRDYRVIQCIAQHKENPDVAW